MTNKNFQSLHFIEVRETHLYHKYDEIFTFKLVSKGDLDWMWDKEHVDAGTFLYSIPQRPLQVWREPSCQRHMERIIVLSCKMTTHLHMENLPL